MWPKIFEFFRETFRSLETLAVVKGTVVVFTNNPPKGHAWFTTVQAFNQQNPQTTFIEKQHKKKRFYVHLDQTNLLKDTVVNRTYHFINGMSLEITSANPLNI